MRILVAGGSGFLGGYVLRAAASRGYEMIALARSAAAARSVTANGARPIAADLDQVRGLDQAFAAAQADALICVASLGRGHGPVIVSAAEEAGIPRAVFVSTTAVTTTLDPPTKQVRLAAEEQIRRCGIDWTILRPTMIYGAPGDRNLSRLLMLLRRTPVLPVPDVGGCLHQPVHVDDVASAVLGAMERSAAIGSMYDVAGPEPIPFADLLRTCARAVASRTRLIPVPLMPLVTLARGYELVSRHPRIRVEQLRRLGEDKAFGIHDAVRDLDYAPRGFDVGIEAEARLLGLAS